MADPLISSTQSRVGQWEGLRQSPWRRRSAGKTCSQSSRKSRQSHRQPPLSDRQDRQLSLRSAARRKLQYTKPHNSENADRGFLHERLSYAWRHPKPFTNIGHSAGTPPPKEADIAGGTIAVAAPKRQSIIAIVRLVICMHNDVEIICRVAF